MAKTLTARQQELVGRVGRSVVPLIRIRTYSDKGAGTVDTDFYVSDRDVIYDYGNTGTLRYFRKGLVSVDRLVSSMTHIPPALDGASPLARTINLVLAQEPLELAGTPFLAELRAKHLELATVEIAELDLNPAAGEAAPDLRALVGDEHLVLGRFEVGQVVRADDETFTLTLRSVEPEIPSQILADIPNNDPRDVGKRKNVLYGAFYRQPCLGVDVGLKMTLAQALTPYTIGNIFVDDASSLPHSGTVNFRVGGEEIAISWVDDTTINIADDSARALNYSSRSSHLLGSVMLEMVSSATWSICDHPIKSVTKIEARNVFNGEIFPLPPESWAAYTDLDGEAFVGIGAGWLRELYRQMHISTAVTNSPTTTVDVEVVLSAQYASSGSAPSAMRDGSQGSGADIDPSEEFTFIFADPGPIVSQIWYIACEAGAELRLTRNGDASIIAEFTAPATGWYAFADAVDHHEVKLKNTGGGDKVIYEVWRSVTYTESLTVFDTDVVGAEIGYGLELFATGEGYVAPDGTNYSVGSGVLLEHPADILRHLIAVRCGQGHGAVSDASFDAAVTSLGTAYKHANVNLWQLGATFPEIAGRIAFEACCNLVQEETSTGTVWRLLPPIYDGTNKWFEFSTSTAVTLEALNWRDAQEIGQEAETIFTRFRVHYDRDPSIEDPEEAFRKVLRIDRVQNDVSAIFNTSEFTTAEQKFGRREHAGFRLWCVSDDDTARFLASYYAQEHLRAARTFEISGLPWWRVYQLERGDIVLVTPSWVGAQIALRVVEHSHELATSDLGLVAVEVRT
jgi:hypothetical protein